MKAARYLVLFMGAAALVAYAQEGEGLTPRLQGAAKSQHQIDMEEGFRLNPTLTIGGAAPDFNLEGVGGKKHTLADWKSANVLAVMFICNH